MGRYKIVIYFVVLSIVCMPNSGACEAARIVVLKTSSHVAAYNVPAAVYVDQMTAAGHQVDVLDLEGKLSRSDELVRQIRTIEPALIFAVGNKAAVVASEAFPDIPILFSMVINWRRLGLQDQENIAGISLEVPPLSQLTQLKLLVPGISRIGLLYSLETPPEFLTQAHADADTLDLHLIARELVLSEQARTLWQSLQKLSPTESVLSVWDSLLRLVSPKQLRVLWREVRDEVDVLWMAPDALVYDEENFRYLAKDAEERKKYFLAYSVNFVKGGALLSISPDYEGIGYQASDLAQRILQGTPCREIGIVSPINTTLALNTTVAESMGIDIAPLLEFVDVIVE